MRLEALGQFKSNDLIGNRTHDLLPCNIVPQQTTLPRAPEFMWKDWGKLRKRGKPLISSVFKPSYSEMYESKCRGFPLY
jgi:hypothetical protein